MVYPFREGKGRCSRSFIALIVYKAHRVHLDYDFINRKEFIQSSKDSTHFDYKNGGFI